MFLMYVDESGDIGPLPLSPTKYFILSAIVIHELSWRDTLTDLVRFRKFLRLTKGLKIREEIHCADFINKPGKLSRIPKHDRLDIIKQCIDWINRQTDLSVFSIVIDKKGKPPDYDFFEQAWRTLLTRFENAIRKNNFHGQANPKDMGIVISDNTDGGKLRTLLRKMRHHNMVRTYFCNSLNLKLQYIIEDPILRDSQYSFIHQMSDVLAYCVKQMYDPNAYIRKKGGHNYYKRLTNVSLKAVSISNDFGIVQ